MEFDFSIEKNEILFEKRGVTFYQIIESIAEKGILLNVYHPNKSKYPNQQMFVVDLDNYTYCVPYIQEGNKYFLKTIYPNRKFLYLLGQKENKNEK